jgi:hypothetical protein
VEWRGEVTRWRRFLDVPSYIDDISDRLLPEVAPPHIRFLDGLAAVKICQVRNSPHTPTTARE